MPDFQLVLVVVSFGGSLKCEANFPRKTLNYLLYNYLREE